MSDYPYKGARKIFSEGLAAAQIENSAPSRQPTEFEGMIVEAMQNAADILTVEIFGNNAQRAETHAWMERNRERR